MKQLPAEKYNIAWFKLAEFVARGEKERALALYRLLSHSLHDDALTFQLEGDLLLAFNDTKGIDSYQKAAQKYYQGGRIAQAALTYEHIVELNQASIGILKLLIELCQQLNQPHKICTYACMLVKKYLADERVSDAQECLQDFAHSFSESQCAELYSTFFLNYLGTCKKSIVDPTLLTDFMERTLDYFLLAENERKLQQFLSTLDAVSETMAEEARKYLEKHL